MKKLTVFIIALSTLVQTRASDLRIYWNNTIPGAHIYQWTTPRSNEGPPLVECFVDLGELPVGPSTFTWYESPTHGGMVAITTPDGFLAYAEVTGSAGVGCIQIWSYQGEYGGNIMEDSVNTGWDFGVVDFSLSGLSVVPDGFGGWVDGDPYTYAAALSVEFTKPNKGKKLGHTK